MYLYADGYNLGFQAWAMEGETAVPLQLILENSCLLEMQQGNRLFYCTACCSLLGATYRIFPEWLAIPAIGKPADRCETDGPGLYGDRPCLPIARRGHAVSVWQSYPEEPEQADGDPTGHSEGPNCGMSPCEACSIGVRDCGFEPVLNIAELGQYVRVQVLDVTASTVLRIRLSDGGRQFSVGSSCDPSGPRNDSTLYAFREDAEAALVRMAAPRLELVPESGFELLSDAGCPSFARVRVTTCNSGSAPAEIAPFRITDLDGSGLALEGDQTAHPIDPSCRGAIAPGECRSCIWTVPLSPGRKRDTPIELRLDPDGFLPECDEASSPDTCAPDRRVAQLVPCENAGDGGPQDVQIAGERSGERVAELGLRVGERADTLNLRWTPSPDEGSGELLSYAVLRGTLQALSEGRYDHALASPTSCGLSAREWVLSGDSGFSCYYVVAPVQSDEASCGHDANGLERPATEVCSLP